MSLDPEVVVEVATDLGVEPGFVDTANSSFEDDQQSGSRGTGLIFLDSMKAAYQELTNDREY
jgi:hypothetical protein